MKKIFTVLVVSLFSVLSAMAQLPYNTTMTGDHYNDATIVKSDGDNGWDGGIRLGNVNGGGFNYSDKYVVIALSENGLAKKITCTTEANSISSITPPTDIVFYIAWSADNNNFTTLETKKSKTNSFDVELPKEAKYIKLCYSGNFGGYFRDIVVEELVYCNAPEHDVWEPIGTIGDEAMLGETTMVWGSTEPFELTLTGEGASQFTVAIDNNACKGKEGVALISAIYKLDVAGVHEAVLTVANGTYSYEIALKGTTLKKDQTIVWNDDLSHVNALDTVSLTASANTAVSYAVSDASVATVEGDRLIAHRAGEVVVYAYAAESDVYEADTLTMTAVVAKVAQEIVWAQDLTGLHALDTVVLNATAMTEVSYAVSDASVATVEGDKLIAHRAGEVVVYAYAVENDVYEADTLSMTAVVSKVAQEIVWVQDLSNLYVLDTVVLNATAKTEVSYAVSDESVATVEGDKLIAHRAGEVVVYTYAAESDVYEADTLSMTAVVSKVAQEIVWAQDLTNLYVLDTVVLNATAKTEVSYAVSDESVATVEGDKLIAHRAGEVVVFVYATESDVYEADTLARTILVAPLAQEIVWALDSLEMTVGDTLVLNAVATSGLEVSYVLNIEGVVLLENNTLVAQSAGEVVVTAVQEGDNRYMAAEEVSYTIIVVEDVDAGFENLSGGQLNTYKVIRDGQIYIIRGEQVYDIFGNQL